jgi:hypothetical protein
MLDSLCDLLQPTPGMAFDYNQPPGEPAMTCCVAFTPAFVEAGLCKSGQDARSDMPDFFYGTNV